MILAIESSASQGSVALVNDDRTVREMTVETPRGRGGALFSALEEILSGREEITRVVVGTGPGSYNGIRAALAVGWGIAAARSVPLVGISSLLGLEEGTYCAAGDARRGQFYFARIESGSFIEEPVLLTEQQLVAAVRQRPGAPLFVPAPLEFLPEAMVRMPQASRLARVAADWPANHPEPLYLKPAHITKPAAR